MRGIGYAIAPLVPMVLGGILMLGIVGWLGTMGDRLCVARKLDLMLLGGARCGASVLSLKGGSRTLLRPGFVTPEY